MGTRALISLVEKPYEGSNWQAINWLPVYWPQPAGTAALVVGLGAALVGLGDGLVGDGDGDGDGEAEADAEPDGEGERLRSRSRETRWFVRSAMSTVDAAAAVGRGRETRCATAIPEPLSVAAIASAITRT
jgi:hypothetical protein